MARRVLVTGGAGFIGANLVRRLAAIEPRLDVVVLDDLSTGATENLPSAPNVWFVRGSILDETALRDAAAGADTIVHLAARPSVPRSIDDPIGAHEANATGTVRVLEEARRLRAHVVVASSSSVYGAEPSLPKHERLPTVPISPYGASKLAAEAYAFAYASAFGLGINVFRFFNVFGPLQTPGHAYAAGVPTFVAAALDGRPLPVHGDGHQTRDFTYVGSVCDVLLRAIDDRTDTPTPVNLAFGREHSLLDLIATLEEVTGRSLEVEHLPRRVGDIRHSSADQTMLRSLYPDLAPVPLQDGLSATVRWFEATRTRQGAS